MILATTAGSVFRVDDATQLRRNSVTFILLMDSVAQEDNETFSFILNIDDINALGINPTLISPLQVTILDGDSKL